MNILTTIPQIIQILQAVMQALSALSGSGVINIIEELVNHITPGKPNSAVLNVVTTPNTTVVAS
jgi:hypothetical protein